MSSKANSRIPALNITRVNTGSAPRIVLAAILDFICVWLFAIIGGLAHDQITVSDFGWGSILQTASHVTEVAAPFLISAFIGWIVALAWHNPLGIAREGVKIWIITVVLGTILRGLTHHDIAIGFFIVGTVFFGITLLGWRGIAKLVNSRKHPNSSHSS